MASEKKVAIKPPPSICACPVYSLLLPAVVVRLEIVVARLEQEIYTDF